MPEPVELIVCDMDGTFLRGDKSITEENRAAIKRARERGIRFSVCTGRIQTMTEFYLKDLSIDTPVITANGALIWDPVRKETLWDLPMEEEEVLAILGFAKEQGLDYCALTMEMSYFCENNVRRQRFEQYNQIAAAHGFPPMGLSLFDEEFACLKGKRVYKILIYEVKEGQGQLAREFLDTLPKTGYTSSEDRLLDIAHRFVNKGSGLVELAKLLGIPLDRVCAMGDYENDIPMLQAAGYSVAMGNGCEEIKRVADFITRSNEESGVAWAMEHFLKIS